MTACPYDLIIGLDRADKKADLCLIESATGQRRGLTLNTAPEALCEWLAELRQQHPQVRVGRCAAHGGAGGGPQVAAGDLALVAGS